MKKCSNCEKDLGLSDKFCDSCRTENEINYIYSSNWKKRGLLGSKGKTHDIIIDDEGLKLVAFSSPWRAIVFFFLGTGISSNLGLENSAFFIGLAFGFLGQIMDNNAITRKRKKWLALDGRLLNNSYKVVHRTTKDKIVSDVDLSGKTITIFNNDGKKLSFIGSKEKLELLNNYIEKYVL